MAPKKDTTEGIEAGIRGLYQDAASLKLEPNLTPQDTQFIDAISGACLKYLQQKAQQKAQQAAMMGQQQAQQALQMGGLGGANPMAGRPPMGTPGGPPSQGAPGLAMPNPEELQRVLAAQAGGSSR